MSLVDRNKLEVTFLRRLRTKLEDGELDAGLVMITRRINSILKLGVTVTENNKETNNK